MSHSCHARIGVAGAAICFIAIALPAWAGDGSASGPNTSQYPGGTIATVGAAIMLLVELLRSPRFGRLVELIPKRWRIAVPVVLGGIAGILSSVAGGVSWQEAMYIGLFAGPTAVFAHEAVVEAILGDARRREGTANEVQVPVTDPASHRQAA